MVECNLNCVGIDNLPKSKELEKKIRIAQTRFLAKINQGKSAEEAFNESIAASISKHTLEKDKLEFSDISQANLGMKCCGVSMPSPTTVLTCLSLISTFLTVCEQTFRLGGQIFNGSRKENVPQVVN